MNTWTAWRGSDVKKTHTCDFPCSSAHAPSLSSIALHQKHTHTLLRAFKHLPFHACLRNLHSLLSASLLSTHRGPSFIPPPTSHFRPAPTGVRVFVLGHVRAARCCDEPSEPQPLLLSYAAGSQVISWGLGWKIKRTSHLTRQIVQDL